VPERIVHSSSSAPLPQRGRTLMQLPIPPEPLADPPSTFLLLYSCVVVVLLTFETIVLFLPEEWRQRISQIQFGPRWTAKRGGQ
jgi:hypothetical protein